PELIRERVEAQCVAHGLGEADETAEDREGEIEHTFEEDPFHVHRKDRRFFGERFGPGCRWDEAAAGPDQVADLAGTLQRNGGERAVILLGARRSAGFEADVGEAKGPRNGTLLGGHVLDAVEGDRAVGAVEQAGFDPDFACSDPEAEVAPAKQGRADRQDREHAEHEKEQQPVTLDSEIATGGEHSPHASAAGAQARTQGEGMQPLRGAKRGVGLGHSKSDRMCWRISSRMSAARSGARPGRTTTLLWVPAVWTTKVAVPKALSTGPRVTSICWTRISGTIVSVWNSHPRTTCSSLGCSA